MKRVLQIPTTSKSIEQKILLIRGNRVLIDADLAYLYGVQTKLLNEQVKRNKNRFPSDFIIQLTQQEKDEVVANCDHLANLKFSPTLPNAFTEYGAIMAASVLNSRQAIETSVFVVRAFVRLRHMLTGYEDLARRITELEKELTAHGRDIASLIKSMKALLGSSPIPPKSGEEFQTCET